MAKPLVSGSNVLRSPLGWNWKKPPSQSRQLEFAAASLDYKWHWHRAKYNPYDPAKPYLKQQQFHELTCHFPAFIGGVGSGKTYAGMARTIQRLIQYPGITWILAAPTYKQLQSSTLPVFFKMLQPEAIHNYSKSDGHLELTNMSEVWMRSTENPTAIEGITAGGFTFDEGSKGPQQGQDIMTERLRQADTPLEGILCTTPNGRNWVWTYYEKPGHNEEYKFIRATSMDNPHSPDFYKQHLKSTRTGTWGEQQIYGLFVSFEGSVYKEYNPELNLIEEADLPKTFKAVLMMHDWGVNNPNALLVGLVDFDNRLYIVDEWKEPNQLIRHIAAQRRLFEAKYVPEGRYDAVGDPAGLDIMNELASMGLSTQSGDNNVSAGLRAVASRLAPSPVDGKPQLFFVEEKTMKLQEEITGYVWEKNKDGTPNKEKPLKVNDHLLDALRYGVMYLDRGMSWSVAPDLPFLSQQKPQPDKPRPMPRETWKWGKGIVRQ